MKKPSLILGIESSCDDTAAAVVKNGRDVLGTAVAHQFDFHREYQGVVPELASRAHVLAINKVVEEALKRAFPSKGKTKRSLHTLLKKVDAIAVTVGPGLAGSLLVGKMTAETLGWTSGRPVLGVNHIEGHLLSPVLVEKKLKPPFLGLVASGGHTELILAKSWGKYFRLGATLDDAAGEAFDKVAKMLNLGYPGGPVIDRLARLGNSDREPFPKPWIPGTWNFSFSGLKTAVLYRVRDREKWTARQKKDLCAGFQHSVVTVLTEKTLSAAHALGIKNIVVGGGVAANSALRARLTSRAEEEGLKVFLVPPAFCTDNAAMVASAAFFKAQLGLKKQDFNLTIKPQWTIPPYTASLPPFRPSGAFDKAS